MGTGGTSAVAKDGGPRFRKPSKEDLFFASKKDWSRTKDRILGAYLVPYLAKVKLRGAPIILFDPYAGPGQFAADGAPGSPLQITQIAEKLAAGRYHVVFGNKRLRSHQQLTTALASLIERKVVETNFQEADGLLMQWGAKLGRSTVFLYLDPPGLPPAFAKLKPFLERGGSTEILLNLFPSAIARHASMGPLTAQIEALHARLTAVLGNEYWRAVYERTDLTAQEKVERVIREYVGRIKKYLPYSGSCPIRQREGSAIKYYMTFFSRHPDAPRIYNEEMRRAYREGLYRAMTKGTLFDGVDPVFEAEVNEVDELKKLILTILENLYRVPRKRLWSLILDKHFMEFGHSNYIAAVQILCDDGRIGFHDIRKTGRLNDDSVLYLKRPAQDEAAA
jgi:three-Cys-motif partner protein